MSSGLGLDKDSIDKTIYDMIIGENDVEEVIDHGTIDNLDILPSNVDLSAVEIELIDVDNKEFIVKDAIQKIRDNYDYIIIDCPPSLSLLTINAMTTADSVLVPIQCEYYALEGLSQLMNTIKLAKKYLNPPLEVEGVVLTMFDPRSNLANSVTEEILKFFGKKVFRTRIPRNVRLGEAPSYGMPVVQFDPKCSGSLAYKALAEEFLARNNVTDYHRITNMNALKRRA